MGQKGYYLMMQSDVNDDHAGRVRSHSGSGERKRSATKSSPEPSEKRAKEDTVNTVANGDLKNNETNDIRKRNIAAKNQALKDKLDAVKEKMKSSENKSSVFDTWYPYIVGGIVVSAALGAFYRYWWSQ